MDAAPDRFLRERDERQNADLQRFHALRAVSVRLPVRVPSAAECTELGVNYVDAFFAACEVR